MHDGRRRPLAPRADPLSFVAAGGRSVYLTGATALFDRMAEAGQLLDGRTWDEIPQARVARPAGPATPRLVR